MRALQSSGQIRMVTAAVCAALFAGAAPARAADSWNKVESRHFLIVGEVGHARLGSIAKTLEEFRLATTLMFPDRLVDADRPLTIVVLQGNSIADYAPGGNIAGLYRRQPDREFIIMRSDAFGGEDFRRVLHEYQHSITHANVMRLPRWAEEGFTEFYSTFTASSDGRYQIGLPIDHHLRALSSKGFVPLEEFFADDGRSISTSDTFRVSVFYAQSWALVHFLTFGDEGKWNPSFTPFLRALVSGEPPMHAFRRTVTTDVETFMAHFRAYPNSSSFSYIWAKFDPDETAVRDSSEGKLSVAETGYLKARLLNDPQKAAKAIDDALTAEPENSPARALKAEYLFARHETAEAADEWSALARASSVDARTCGLAMLALNLLARHEESLAVCSEGKTRGDVGSAFERAVALEALGRQAEAAPVYTSVGMAPEARLSALRWHGRRHLEQGQFVAARRAADIWLARASGDSDGIASLVFSAGRRDARKIGVSKPAPN